MTASVLHTKLVSSLKPEIEMLTYCCMQIVFRATASVLKRLNQKAKHDCAIIQLTVSAYILQIADFLHWEKNLLSLQCIIYFITCKS